MHEWWQLAVFAAASFVVSILNGISGGGGGFVMTPLMILLGLSPAQAVSTGKVSGLTVAIGCLDGMRSVHGRLSKWRVIPVMALALAVGLFVPHVIRSLDGDVYRIILGVLLILMVPVMLVKKVGIHPHAPKTWQKYVGSMLLAVSLFLQGAFSGGLGTLVNIVLMSMLGMTATEANVTKRWSQIILNVTVVIGVFFSHLIVWRVAAVAIPTTFIGGYIGGHLAVKKGDNFVRDVMVGLMIVSAFALIFGV